MRYWVVQIVRVLLLAVLALFIGIATNILSEQVPQTWVDVLKQPTVLIGLIAVVVVALALVPVIESIRRRDTSVVPSSLTPLQQNRQQLMENVRIAWIEGVLEQPLFAAIQLDLAVRTDLEQLLRPAAEVQHTHVAAAAADVPQQTVAVADAESTILALFRTSGALLILGEPGSGKTTQLLTLTRALLADTTPSNAAPIPVVLSLTTWASDRRPLREWIADELRLRYGVPAPLAREWAGAASPNAARIVVLLDGLDEVNEEARPACVAAINAYRQGEFVPLVVGSRYQEYRALEEDGHALTFAAVGVLLQAPKVSAVERTLRQMSPRLDGVLALLPMDSSLRRAAQNPFYLSAMILGYRGRTRDELAGPTTDTARARHIVAAFVAAMLSRQPVSPRDEQRSRQRLSWLAQRMRGDNKTIFYLEEMQPQWLRPGWQRRVMYGLIIVSGGLVWGLFNWALFHSFFGRSSGDGTPALMIAISGVVSGGLGCGLLAFKEITTIDRLIWSRAHANVFVRRLINQRFLRYILFFMSTIGLVIGFTIIGTSGLVRGLTIILASGLISIFIISVLWLLVSLPEALRVQTVVSIRQRPNDGIVRSIGSAFMGGIFYFLVGFLFGRLYNVNAGLMLGLILGFGLSMVEYGGLHTLRHYTLRLILSWSGTFPLRAVPFLDECVRRLLLRRVGGGWVFVHRLVLEYFADMADEEERRSSGLVVDRTTTGE